jgi:acylphosphatase
VTGTEVPPATDRARLDATVLGRVQGVGFRFFAIREAMDLGLDGWVQNTPAGTVHAVAEGPRGDLERFVARLQDGPPGAVVERVLTRWQPASGDLGPFRILSGGHPGD